MVESFINSHQAAIADLRQQALDVEKIRAIGTAENATKIDEFNKIMRRIAKLEARVAAAERYRAYKAELVANVVFADGVPCQAQT